MSLKLGGVALLWLGVAWLLFATASNPRSLPSRLAAAYASGIDADLRSMFMRPRGAELGWLQLAAMTTSVLAYALTRVEAFLALAAAIAVGPRLAVTILARRRRAKLDDQAHAYALVLANTLKTTANLGDAIRFSLEVTSNPMHQEIDTALREVRVGSTLEEALLAASARARSSALDVVVSALLIGQRTGGDLPRILEGTAASLRELKRLEELTDRVTRSAKQSVVVAACITAGLALMLPRVMPGFFDPLASSTKGQLLAAQCAAVYLLALFLGWRFTRKSI
ncbi:MAG: type II secretion system F family protein [Deltaproteobacteria bacterium]|nr:type II secretion system F family protein [Deltaproteobacteria bacterium]